MRRFIGLAAIGIFCAVGAAPSWANATVPTVTVRPNHALVAGQTVKVHWSGFRVQRSARASSTFTVRECNPSFPTESADACTIIGTIPTIPFPHSGSIDVQVVTGAIGANQETCGTKIADRDCYIWATVMLNGVQLTGTATRIRFTVPT